MGLFENFPYTNFHRENLDWLLLEMKSITAEWVVTKQEFSDIKEDFQELETYVQNYFNNLDVTEEVRQILDEMVSSGDFDAILANLISSEVSAQVPSTVTAWLQQNVNPVGSAVTLDSSLTIAGSAADAKAVGDALYKKADKSVLSINRFDPKMVEAGYISYTNGTFIPNASFYASDYIPVVPGTAYRIINNSSNQQLALYDANKNYVSGYASSNNFNNAPNASQIPAGAAYIRFTIGTADLQNVGFYNKDEYTWLRHWIPNFNVFSYGIVADRLKDGTIEFSRTVSTVSQLLDAINLIGLTDGYHYTIYLEAGTYTLTAANIATLRDNAYGLTLPDNTDLIGLGSGAIIELDMTGAAAALQIAYSTLNVKYNNRLENITAYATNCRYVVHADNGNSFQDYKQTIKDCVFIHNGNSDNNWAYPAAWGEGFSGGVDIKFLNCKFSSPLRSYYMHNYQNLAKPTTHLFESCIFTSPDELAVQMESMGSSVTDTVIFNGCSFNGLMRGNANSLTPTASNDFKVSGSGNSPVCEDGIYNGAFTYLAQFKDECMPFVNKTGAAIPAGTFLKLNSSNYEPMTGSDPAKTFAGFTIAECLPNETGTVKVRGTIRTTGNIGYLTQGSRLTISSGSLAEAAAGDDIVGRVYKRFTTYNRQYSIIEA